MKRIFLLLTLILFFISTAEARPLRFIQKYNSVNFTPRSINGLTLWLDASDLSTITIATGVSQWSDKSGQGRHAVQATGGNQPTSGANTINGRNVIKFGNNAAQKYMVSSGVTGTSNTVIAVYKSHAAAFVDWEGVITARAGGLSFKAPSSTYPAGFTGDLSFPTAVCNVGQSTVSAWLDGVQGSAASFDNFAGGGLPTAPINSVHALLLTDNNDTCVENYVIGADTFDVVGTRHFDGDIAELIVYSPPLTGQQIMRMFKYIKIKWGTP